MDLKVYYALPLRLSMLLSRSEQRQVSETVDGLLTKWDTSKIVESYEKKVRDEHRVVRGTFLDGSVEYRYHKGTENDEDLRYGDCLAFWHSEFPATANECGNKLPEKEVPVEFVMTSRFTAMLLVAEGAARGGKFKSIHHSRLVVRRGITEASFVLNGEKVSSVADAILAVEGADGNARRWLGPVSTEIVECNLLGG